MAQGNHPLLDSFPLPNLTTRTVSGLTGIYSFDRDYLWVKPREFESRSCQLSFCFLGDGGLGCAIRGVVVGRTRNAPRGQGESGSVNLPKPDVIKRLHEKLYRDEPAPEHINSLENSHEFGDGKDRGREDGETLVAKLTQHPIERLAITS
jgi:hypothetical protein